MIETWLERAHPGLPRTAVWLLAWLVLPLILPVAVALELAVRGIAEAGPIWNSLAGAIPWLWRQRPALNSDPWKRIQ